MRPFRPSGPLRIFLVLAVGLAACGGSGPDPGEPIDPPAQTEGEEPTPTEEPTGEEQAGEPPSPEALEGEAWDGPPLNGAAAELAVVGVAADDVLHVRAGPGVGQDVVAELGPLATGVRATGAARQLPESIWLEVEVDGTTGWVSSAFLAFLGATDDITAQLLEQAGERPSAATLVELAEAVAALRASDDSLSRVTISAGPDVGDLGEVTVDVVGLGDDSVFAERLVVFATEDDSGDGFTLRTVEATTFCARGVSGELCV